MHASNLSLLVKQSDSLLESITNILLQDEVDQEDLERRLGDHSRLFEAFFEEHSELSEEHKLLIKKHLEKLVIINHYCQEQMSLIDNKFGLIKRGQKVKKAYGR